MFQDEARFGRINEPKRCWVPGHIRPVVGCQIVREYTYAYGAVSPIDGAMDSLVLPETNTELMVLFLNEVSKRHRGEYIVMFMDGASWHTTENLNVPNNMRIELLPPYAAELNPTEHLWEEIREKWFGNKVFESMDAVESQLVESLAKLEEDPIRVENICGFEWIVTPILNAT